MNRQGRHVLGAAPRAFAALVLVLAPAGARADVTRTGTEPWYAVVDAETQARAKALFADAVGLHQRLLRRDAVPLYEQAVALWDNPDIRWNLASALIDINEYVRAYEQLEKMSRWDEALGPERRDGARKRMSELDSEHLARIEADAEPGADIQIDERRWVQDALPASVIVVPGEHFLASTKPGYLTIATSVSAEPGRRYRVTLRMTPDRVTETRRWSAWKPWAVVAGGAGIAAAGTALNHYASVHRDRAAKAVAGSCDADYCDPVRLGLYDRARWEHRLATGAFIAGGAAAAIGLVLAWIDQPRLHRPEAMPARVKLVSVVSSEQVGISASFQF